MLPHCPSPRVAENHTNRSPLWEKRTQPALPQHWVQFARAPILISYHGDCGIICGIQPLGIWTVTQKRGGTYNDQHMGLSRLSHTCCTHVIIPTSNLLFCRAKLGAHSDLETQWGADLSDMDPQTRSFVRPYA